ncbi:MAG: hypothetical protein IMZ50_04255, partial [Candidatus Atribacteria bacterium]|nr:hypothetical protein [Candidatus Atribacteria bacterium]
MSWLDEDEKLVGVAAPSSVSSSRQTNWLDEDEALLGIAPPKAEAGTFAQMAEGIIDLKTHNQKTWADNADIVIGKMEQAAGRPLEDRVKGHIYSEAQREALRLGGTPTPTLDEEKAQLGAAHAKGAGFLTNVSVGGTRALASFPLGAAGLIAPRKVAELEKAADDAGLYGTGAGGTVGSVLGNAIVMAPAAAAGAGTLLARAMPFMYGATAGGGARTNVARAKMEGTYDPLLDLGADSLNEFADVVVTAAAEYAFEKWGMNIALRGAGIGKALKDSLKASVAATGAEGLAKWFGQFAKTYGGKLAGVMLEGAGEESGTQLAQNISDKLFVRSKTPITAGIGEAAVAGGLAPVLMAPLGLTGAGGAATQTETAPPVRALPRPTFEEETAEVATAMDAGEQARYAPPGEVATGVAQGQEGN